MKHDNEISYEDAHLAGRLYAEKLWLSRSDDIISEGAGCKDIPNKILKAKPSKLAAYLEGYESFFNALRDKE